MGKHKVNLVSKKDLVIEHFHPSGAGGQHRDKTSNAVRIRHPASGAVGESQDSRSQDQNTRMAFRRLVNSPVFQVWLDLEVHPDKLKVEIRKGGEWVAV